MRDSRIQYRRELSVTIQHSTIGLQ